MRNFYTLYYFLIVLLIMGTLASMAQNDYGQKILGFVAFSFSISFLFLILSERKNQSDNFLEVPELACLFLLSAILGCRTFYIHFPLVEYLFGLTGAVLVGIYIARAVRVKKYFGTVTPLVSTIIVIYVTIILYTLSMTVTPFLPEWSETFGKAAFGVFILAMVLLFRTKAILFKGEKITPVSWLSGTQGLSLVLLTVYLLFTAYIGLTSSKLLPTMYSGEYPRAYVELVKQAETGHEKPGQDGFRHERFKANYDALVDRNADVAEE